MKKVYKSNIFARTFEGTRTEAIKAAIEYFKAVWPTFGEEEIKRYTWRADDDSGFTVTCTPKSNTVYCSHKWNANRN